MADGRSVRTKGHQSSFTQETLDPAQLHAQKHVEPTCRRLGGCCVLALQPCHWKEHAVHSRLRAASHMYAGSSALVLGGAAILTTRSPRPDHALRHEYATPSPSSSEPLLIRKQIDPSSTSPFSVFRPH
ncbi:hypothetical protein IG631_14963 [Alternaria alternata]|nr:hypothetical protein IG631_14963 [Alternaria alternata]